MHCNRPFSIISYWAAFLLAAHFLLPGCASYGGKTPPIPLPEMMPYSYRDNRLEIYADPYVQLDRQREYFDAELGKLGVIPIHILIRNNSDRSFSLPYTAISLELADGTRIPRSHLDVFMEERSVSQDEPNKVKAPQKEEEPSGDPSEAAQLGKAALAGALAGVIQGALPLIVTGVVISSPVWVPIVYAVHRSNEAWRDRLADYREKELEFDIVLDKDKRASHGFAFFVIPPDIKLSATANLVFSFLEETSEQPAAVTLYLKELGLAAERVGLDAPP
jgi:hypothetical protein